MWWLRDRAIVREKRELRVIICHHLNGLFCLHWTSIDLRRIFRYDFFKCKICICICIIIYYRSNFSKLFPFVRSQLIFYSFKYWFSNGIHFLHRFILHLFSKSSFLHRFTVHRFLYEHRKSCCYCKIKRKE